MKRIPLIILAAWLLTLLVAFAVGRISKAPVLLKQVVNAEGSPSYEPYEAPVFDMPSPTEVAEQDSGGSPLRLEAGSSSLTPRRTGNSASVNELRVNYKNVNDALFNNDPVERMRTFADMLSKLTPENARMMVDSIDSMPQGYDRNREKSLLLYAWAQVDGAAAIDYADNNGEGWGKQMNAYAVLKGWATKDTDAAVVWAREKHEGEDNPYLIGIIHGLANTDLKGATDLTYDLPYGRNRGKAVDALINGYFQKGTETAMDWADSLPESDAQLKNGIYQRVAEKVAREDPYRAAEWVMNSPEGETRTQAIGEVADTWAEQNPAAAARWVSGLDESPEKTEAMSEVVSEWAKKDPEKAADWLNEQPKSEALDKPIERFAWRMMRSDPETAMVWAGSITDTERRRSTLEKLAGEWMKRDPQRAGEFLK